MLHLPALQTPSCCRLDTEPVHACPSVAAHGLSAHSHHTVTELRCHWADNYIPAFLAGVASVCPAMRAVTTQAMVWKCILTKDCIWAGSGQVMKECLHLLESSKGQPNQLEMIKNDELWMSLCNPLRTC